MEPITVPHRMKHHMKHPAKFLLAALSLAALAGFRPAQAQDATAAEPPATAAPAAVPMDEPSTLESVLEAGVLRVGVNPDFRPFSFENDAGERVGVDIELARALSEALGVELEADAPEAFADLLPMLEAGELDVVIAGMSITFERAMRVDFSEPYFDTGVSAMMNVGTSARLGIAEADTADELLAAVARNGPGSDLVIAVTEGRAPEAVARERFPEATIRTYPSNEAAAEATLNGEANLMVHDEIFLKVWLEEQGGRATNRLKVLDPPMKADFYGIAARQGDPGWMRLLDVFVDRLRADDAVRGWLGEYLPGASLASTAAEVPVFDVRTIEE